MLQIQQNIILIRGLTNLNQEDFGLLIGATKAMVTSYETGVAAPKKIMIKNRICELAGVTLDQLENKRLKESDIKIKADLLEKVDFLAKPSTAELQANSYPPGVKIEQVIAAKDQVIASIERTIAAKEETIASKEEIIAVLQEQIKVLSSKKEAESSFDATVRNVKELKDMLLALPPKLVTGITEGILTVVYPGKAGRKDRN